MNKVRFGICAFNVVDSFRTSLKALRSCADSITVVYGRFQGFDHPWVEPPAWLSELSTDFIISDHKRTQHEQRNLCLHNVEDGDLLFIMDSDWIPVITSETFPTLINMKDWDSGLVNIYEPRHTIGIIAVYKFRKGWTHSPGQLLMDEDGNTITSGNYQVVKIPTSTFSYLHDSRKVYDEKYNDAYNLYWKNLNTPSMQ